MANVTLLEEEIAFTENKSDGDSLPKLCVFHLIEVSFRIISDFFHGLESFIIFCIYKSRTGWGNGSMCRGVAKQI